MNIKPDQEGSLDGDEEAENRNEIRQGADDVRLNVAEGSEIGGFVRSGARHAGNGIGLKNEAGGDEHVCGSAEDDEVENAEGDHLGDGEAADGDTERRQADLARRAALAALVGALHAPLVEAALVDVGGRADAVAGLEKILLLVAFETDSANDFFFFLLFLLVLLCSG